jgi:hypothetical protein
MKSPPDSSVSNFYLKEEETASRRRRRGGGKQGQDPGNDLMTLVGAEEHTLVVTGCAAVEERAGLGGPSCRETRSLAAPEEPAVLNCRSFRLVSSLSRVSMELGEVCSSITMATSHQSSDQELTRVFAEHGWWSSTTSPTMSSPERLPLRCWRTSAISCHEQ